jgi:hypothetical protein
MIKTLLNLKVILGILLLAFLLLVATLVIIFWVNPVIFKPDTAPFTSAFTIIPAMTSTPRYVTPSLAPVSPTPPPTNTPLPGTIALNTYVQITGTGGDGLRLRASPGLSSDPLFFGNESEVFLVTDGPAHADGYTWWYLTAPYDQTRAGWAVATFLAYIPSP